MVDVEKIWLAVIGVIGSGLGVAAITTWANRRRTDAEAVKAKAEADRARAEARKFEAEGSPDQVTIASLLQALKQLQDQLRAQQDMFASRETFLLGRIDAMEQELIGLRVKNGSLIEQIGRLEALVRENGREARRAANVVVDMAHKAHLTLDVEGDGTDAGVPTG